MTATTATRRPTARTSAPKTTAVRKPTQGAASTKTTARRQRVGADAAGHAGSKQSTGHPKLAADEAVRRDSTHLQLPVIGELNLPAPDQVAFIGGVAVMTFIGIIEWPVAALLSVGHILATNHHAKLVRAFGDALEEA